MKVYGHLNRKSKPHRHIFEPEVKIQLYTTTSSKSPNSRKHAFGRFFPLNKTAAHIKEHSLTLGIIPTHATSHVSSASAKWPVVTTPDRTGLRGNKTIQRLGAGGRR